VEEIYVIPIQFFLEIYYFPADFPADLDKKSAGNTLPAKFPADSGFQLKPL
jgi:hypothetical protein